jgi:hypothetical protein
LIANALASGDPSCFGHICLWQPKGDLNVRGLFSLSTRVEPFNAFRLFPVAEDFRLANLWPAGLAHQSASPLSFLKSEILVSSVFMDQPCFNLLSKTVGGFGCRIPASKRP